MKVQLAAVSLILIGILLAVFFLSAQTQINPASAIFGLNNLADVQIQTPFNLQGLIYNSTTGLWMNQDITSTVSIPNIGPYSFLISANDPVPGNYSARYPNGTIGWTSTNCSATIELTVQNMVSGQSLVFNSGIFPIAYNLTVTTPNLSFKGVGKGSILQLNANYTGMFGVSASGVAFENLAFDGNKANAKTFELGHAKGYGIDYRIGNKLNIDKCYFYNFREHAFVSFPATPNGHNAEITNCNFENNEWWDVAFAGGNYSLVSGCTFTNTAGVELGTVSGAASFNGCNNNVFLNSTGITVPVAGGFNSIVGNKLVNCTNIVINGGVTFDVITIQSSYNIIADNTIDKMMVGSYRYGINVQGTHNQVLANTINNLHGTGCKAIGIVGGSFCSVYGNKINNIAGYGLFIYDTAVNSTLTNNLVSLVGTPITDTGTGTRAWLNFNPVTGTYLTAINPPLANLSTGALP